MAIRTVLGLLGVGGLVLTAVATPSPSTSRPPSSAPLQEPRAPPDSGAVLRSRVVHQSDALAMPTVVEVAGDRLVIADDFADRSIRVLRREDGAVERAFGRKGRGPREFETVFTIDVIDPTGRLLVHDPVLQRITWIDLERDFAGDRWVADRTVRLDAPAMVLTLGFNGTELMGTGAFVDGRLVHLGLDGRLIAATGAPPVPPGEVRKDIWVRAYQARMKAAPTRTRWAVVSRFADRLEIFDSDGRLLVTGDRVDTFGPADLEEDDPDRVRFGYIDLATTASRIYALYSGRTRAEGQANYGHAIHVFDWDGTLRDVLRTDSPLIAVAVTPDGRTLYGIRHEPVPAIVTYSLE